MSSNLHIERLALHHGLWFFWYRSTIDIDMPSMTERCEHGSEIRQVAPRVGDSSAARPGARAALIAAASISGGACSPGGNLRWRQPSPACSTPGQVGAETGLVMQSQPVGT